MLRRPPLRALVLLAVLGSVTLVTTVSVDPPSSAAPGGQIWESSELDNVRTKVWNCDAIGCVEQPGDPVPICPG